MRNVLPPPEESAGTELKVLPFRLAFWLVVACLGTGFLLGGVVQSLVARLPANPVYNNLGLLMGEALLLVPLLFFLRAQHLTLKQLLPRTKVPLPAYFMAGLLLLAVMVFSEGLTLLLEPLFPMPEIIRELSSEINWTSTADLLSLLLAAAVVAPIVEEILFRGILQTSVLAEYRTLLPALVIPTSVFTMFHFAYLLYIPAVVQLILLALALSYVVAKTGDLRVAVILHAGNNLISIVTAKAAGEDQVFFLRSAAYRYWWLLLAALALAVSLGYFLRRPTFIPDPPPTELE